MRTPLALCALLAVSVPARAGSFSAAAIQGRVAAVLGPWGWAERPQQQADTVPAARGRALQQPTPLISRALWDQSPAPDAAILGWLGQRIPGLDAASVHEVSYAAVAGVIDEAARRRDSTLDIFTDEGLRGGVSYYLSAATLQRLFATHDLHTALMASGYDTDGHPFQMQGLVMGRGALYVLYSGSFDFDNPGDGKRYNVQSLITQRIEGPGSLAVSGMKVKVWPFWPTIQRLVKVGPGRMRVETDKGSREMDDTPVGRR